MLNLSHTQDPDKWPEANGIDREYICEGCWNYIVQHPGVVAGKSYWDYVTQKLCFRFCSIEGAGTR